MDNIDFAKFCRNIDFAKLGVGYPPLCYTLKLPNQRLFHLCDNEVYFEHTENDFAKVLTSAHFVDKTKFIQTILDERKLLITAPARFGKTVNMNMFKIFIETEKGVASSLKFTKNDNILVPTGQLTENFHKIIDPTLDVYKKTGPHFWTNHFGQYPVVHVDFRNLQSGQFKVFKKNILMVYLTTFKTHDYLLLSADLTDQQRRDFNKFLTEDHHHSIPEKEIEMGIQLLCELLYIHYGVKVYVLVDHLDMPILNLIYDNSVHHIDRNLAFLRNIVDSMAKQTKFCCGIYINARSPSLAKLLLGNSYYFFKHKTYLDEKNFKAFTGFTEEELKKLLTSFQTENNAIQEWYGYKDLYNPWSVISYLYKQEIDSYWTANDYKINLKVLNQVQKLTDKIDTLLSNEPIMVYCKTVNCGDIRTLRRIFSAPINCFLLDEEINLFFQHLYDHGFLIFYEDAVNGWPMVKVPNQELMNEFRLEKIWPLQTVSSEAVKRKAPEEERDEPFNKFPNKQFDYKNSELRRGSFSKCIENVQDQSLPRRRAYSNIVNYDGKTTSFKAYAASSKNNLPSSSNSSKNLDTSRPRSNSTVNSTNKTFVASSNNPDTPRPRSNSSASSLYSNFVASSSNTVSLRHSNTPGPRSNSTASSSYSNFVASSSNTVSSRHSDTPRPRSNSTVISTIKKFEASSNNTEPPRPRSNSTVNSSYNKFGASSSSSTSSDTTEPSRPRSNSTVNSPFTNFVAPPPVAPSFRSRASTFSSYRYCPVIAEASQQAPKPDTVYYSPYNPPSQTTVFQNRLFHNNSTLVYITGRVPSVAPSTARNVPFKREHTLMTVSSAGPSSSLPVEVTPPYPANVNSPDNTIACKNSQMDPNQVPSLVCHANSIIQENTGAQSQNGNESNAKFAFGSNTEQVLDEVLSSFNKENVF